jgi:hypothetical protein
MSNQDGHDMMNTTNHFVMSKMINVLLLFIESN